MTPAKQRIIDYIEQNASVFTSVSDQIWELAELSLKEFASAQLYLDALKQGGFPVEENICGIQTAFSGSFGHGKPVIGILAEFDALSGLSQKAGQTQREELVQGGSGHGCGHNMLGAGSLAAAFAIKDYLSSTEPGGHRDLLRLPRRGRRRGQGLHGAGPGCGKSWIAPSPGIPPTPTRSPPAPVIPASRPCINSTAWPPTPAGNPDSRPQRPGRAWS